MDPKYQPTLTSMIAYDKNRERQSNCIQTKQKLEPIKHQEINQMLLSKIDIEKNAYNGYLIQLSNYYYSK